MVMFFVIAALLVVAAVGVTIAPVLRSRAPAQDHRELQNIAIARERLSQLEAQVASGAVTPQQAEQEKTEIELALLDDIDRDTPGATQPQAAGGEWTGVAVVAVVPILAGVLYLTLGQPAALLPAPAVDNAGESPHSGADLASMVQRLEQRLAAAPNDIDGWRMLGNSYMMLKQYDRAALVFQKMRELAGDDPDLLVRQADALAMARGGALAGEPEALVSRALQLDPNHAVGLWLAGLAASRKGDNEAALRFWQRAEPLFAGDPSLAELQGLIARARREMGSDAGEERRPADSASSGPASSMSAGKTGGVKLLVSLDESLQAGVNGQETLFVLARAVNGPPMPLAVVRRRAADLPLTITLDDTMAMTPELKLSNYQEVAVVAKVSRSGDATTRSGDLVGELSPVPTGSDQTVSLVIAERAP